MAVDFIRSDLNPEPPGGQILSITTQDGVVLRTAAWPAAGNAPKRGVVLLLQGRAEFIEKYFEIIGGLTARGFAVVTFDWRGQGGSDRALANRHVGHVRHFDDFRLDYEAVRESIPAEAGSVTVIAHSMGGAVALAAAREGWLRADRLVCTNPMVGLSLVRAPGFTRRLARTLAFFGLGGRIVPGGVTHSISTLPFPNNRLSTDAGRYARNAELAAALEWGAIGSPSIGWVDAAFTAMARLSQPDVARGLQLPVLMLLSGRDPVCSTPAMTAFAEALPQGRTVVIADARHEIMMESDAILARFWTAFDAFVAEPAARSAPAAAG